VLLLPKGGRWLDATRSFRRKDGRAGDCFTNTRWKGRGMNGYAILVDHGLDVNRSSEIYVGEPEISLEFSLPVG
jgi:hypothetical protein